MNCPDCKGTGEQVQELKDVLGNVASVIYYECSSCGSTGQTSVIILLLRELRRIALAIAKKRFEFKVTFK